MSDSIRTYGGWRRRRGLGLAGMDTTTTFLALGAALVFLIAASLKPTVLLYLSLPVVLIGLLCFIHVGGQPVATFLLARIRWWWSSVRGYTRYRAGIVVDHPRAFQLPGVLAPLTLLSAEDGYGSRYGVIWDRRTGFLTATLNVTPASPWLADRDEADAWVASWGGWLASLGHMPAVRWVTVTVETAPSPGATLSDVVTSSIKPNAPRAAQEILGQLVASAPAASAEVDTRVSVTFDPKRTQAKDLTQAVAELGRILDSLAGRLGGCGVSVAGRMNAAQLAGTIRTAFDPHSRAEVTRLLSRPDSSELLGWADSGPVHAVEHPNKYEHDGGTSVTWAWQEPPRQNVHSDILTRLVAPGPYPKRITLQYRALDSATASRTLQNEVNAAAFRAQVKQRTGRDETAHDAWDAARARQAAAEEAAGAGLCLVSLYATVTVTDPEQLSHAVADVESASDSSKTRLRILWGSQAAGFATTLPCGICPTDLTRRSI
ncbi:SCO6880 family protein [Actinocorallia populi]|uniref:SCO6880 family protein n=1 Tax=Actinocorallia populi TaxID=2079200 RepID=UPI000D09092E|nr:SCO6880 family protein [Actinocorallia populi]